LISFASPITTCNTPFLLFWAHAASPHLSGDNPMLNNNRDDAFETITASDGRRVRVLKDKHTFRVGSVHMMDSRRAQVVTDQTGDTRLNRPGPRLLHSDAMIAQRRVVADARAAYDRDLVEAWRTPQRDADAPPAGAYPITPGAEGCACTVDGRPGTLVRRGAWLVCVADETNDARRKAAAEPDDDDDDEDDDDEDDVESTSDSVQKQMKAHQDSMDKLYSQMDVELANKWRGQT
jgi:hypothetical protein